MNPAEDSTLPSGDKRKVGEGVFGWLALLVSFVIITAAAAALEEGEINQTHFLVSTG